MDELTRALETYKQDWQVFADARQQKDFFASLRPVAVAWKVADKTDFDACFTQLFEKAERVNSSWIDERWLASFYLKEPLPVWGLRHIKLMQRRPAKPSDATGLDHVDFLLPTNVDAPATLRQEPEITWNEERGDLVSWVSMWFNQKEAKLRAANQTTVDAILREWQTIHTELQGDAIT